jgi:hypothetical protein
MHEKLPLVMAISPFALIIQLFVDKLKCNHLTFPLFFRKIYFNVISANMLHRLKLFLVKQFTIKRFTNYSYAFYKFLQKEFSTNQYHLWVLATFQHNENTFGRRSFTYQFFNLPICFHTVFSSSSESSVNNLLPKF